MAHQIISREEAINRGLNRYFTGKPCKHGHVSERYTKTFICVACMVALNATRPLQQKTVTIRKAKDLALDRYFTGEPCKRGHIAERYVTSGDCVECGIQRATKRYETKTALCRESNRIWKHSNPQKVRDLNRIAQVRRRALKASAPGVFTLTDWLALVARSSYCHWCKRPWTKERRPTHDHVIPLSKGGANSVENSVCACHECNVRKRTRLINPTTGQGILI